MNIRTYGEKPFNIAVIHGGPGAGGEMAPVARELSPQWGILEPIQCATTLAGQIEELRMELEQLGNLPIILVGFSWGAWLSYFLAAYDPTMVKKLILVSSGPFEEKYVPSLEKTRMSRLSPQEQDEFHAILKVLNDSSAVDKDVRLQRLGALAAKTDQFEEEPAFKRCQAEDAVGLRGDIYQNVWNEAAEMRKNGSLLALAQKIRCPVVAIHGNEDPHPADGVMIPLAESLVDFRFIRLQQCGHTPWTEKYAREPFFQILKAELAE